MTKKILTTLALSAVLIAFNSCKKDDDGPVAPAEYMVVHSTPGAPAVELYLDDVKATTSPVQFGSYSNYSSIASKQYNVKIAAVNTINPISETTVNLDGGNNYSIFSYDTLLNGKAKVFAIRDDLSAPPAGKAKVRFFHLVPGANVPNVDIAANNTVLFPNRSFADNVSDGGKANFITVDAGTYTVTARLAGSTTIDILNVPGVVIEAGKIYTIIAKGRIGGSGDAALGAQVIVNK
ncbi:MAG: DUF4397 domain-containing protein [Chitinophagaceae bacterium]|nr:MAG: DUF4397 domain-containing protein [Chitinophagaceae bacterium]